MNYYKLDLIIRHRYADDVGVWTTHYFQSDADYSNASEEDLASKYWAATGNLWAIHLGYNYRVQTVSVRQALIPGWGEEYRMEDPPFTQNYSAYDLPQPLAVVVTVTAHDGAETYVNRRFLPTGAYSQRLGSHPAKWDMNVLHQPLLHTMTAPLLYSQLPSVAYRSCVVSYKYSKWLVYDAIGVSEWYGVRRSRRSTNRTP